MSEKEEYVTFRLPRELVDEMDKLIGKRGFRSRAEIAKEAIRIFLDHYKELIEQTERFEYFNYDEEKDLFRVHDRKLKIYAEMKPIELKNGEGALYCLNCQSTTCDHIKFAVTQEKVKKLFAKKGWSLPEPQEVEEWWGCPDLNRGPESPSLGA